MINKHKQKSDETKRKMKEVAFRLFAEKGYSATSIDDITKEAGYTKGAFYAHFNNKEEIFLMIMDERMIEQQKEIFEKLDFTIESPRELLSKCILYMIKITQKELWTPMYIEFLANSNRSTEIQDRMAFMYESWRRALVKAIDRFREQNLIRSKLSSELLATTIIAIFDGFNIQHHVDRKIDLHKQFDVIYELLF